MNFISKQKNLKFISNNVDYDTAINKIIEVIITKIEPIILLDIYLIIFKIFDQYTDNYANNFFNKLFLKMYYRFPNTIISLFFELPNYKFLMGFIKYIIKEMNNNNSRNEIIHKLYNKILRIYSEQLKRDFYLIENYKGDYVRISDASLYITYINADSDPENDIKDMINTNLAIKIYGTKNNLNSISKYCDMMHKLLFNIKILNDEYKNYIYENNLDTNNLPKLCLKLFNKYFYKEIIIQTEKNETKLYK